MSKPLKDWTLAEAKNYALTLDCSSKTGSECRECKLLGICDEAVEMWDLEEVPKWTEKEKNLAKAIKELSSRARFLEVKEYAKEYSNIAICFGSGNVAAYIDRQAFPSLLASDGMVALDDIIGEQE